MKITSLIIDDDAFIRDLLRDKLEQHFPEVTVVNRAANGEEGLKMIQLYSPDLVFLDVEMSDMTGFEMLSKLSHIPFRTIFITSYSHYAIKAIRFNALDYLIKPININELKAALERYKERVRNNVQTKNLQQALQSIKAVKPTEQKLLLHTQEGDLFLSLKNIIHIEGERNYSHIYLANDNKTLVAKPLGELESLLTEKGFFRCHKSHLINFQHIKSYPNSTSLILSNDSTVPIARRKKEEFRNWHEEQKDSD